MNYDKLLCDIFFIDDWHFNKSNLEKYKSHYKKKDKYQNIINYIQNRYNDSLSFKETLYRVKYNILSLIKLDDYVTKQELETSLGRSMVELMQDPSLKIDIKFKFKY